MTLPVATGDSDLRSAVKAAADENRYALMRESLRPYRPGTYYRRPGTEFIRILRDHPELRELGGAEAAEKIGALLVELLAVPEIDDLSGRGDEFMRALGDQDTLGKTVRFDREAFMARWDLVKPREGLRGAVADAVDIEEAGSPGDFGARLAHRLYRNRRIFLRTCIALADTSEGGVFPLPQAVLSKAMGVPQQTISDWVRWAQSTDNQFLILVDKDVPHQRAATYRLGPELDAPVSTGTDAS